MKGDDSVSCPHRWFVNAEKTQKYKDQRKHLDVFAGEEFSSCDSGAAIVSLVENTMSAESQEEVGQAVQQYRGQPTGTRSGVKVLVQDATRLVGRVGAGSVAVVVLKEAQSCLSESLRTSWI